MAHLTTPVVAVDLAGKDTVAPSTVPDLVQAASEDKPTNKRDPHILPTFSRSASPILYLPPLLSSLPEGVVHPGYPFSSPSTPGTPRPLSTTARLPTIDHASLSLHRALHNFHPVTDDYAITPYADAFNWGELELPEGEEREWYCVAFRSKRKDGSDGGRESLFHTCFVHSSAKTPLPATALYEADKKAHEEAVQNGGVSLKV